ncbi:MAG: DUF4209 domain-containing protein [Candidatus Cloacimonetes bacterium]|jgi:hypothetical protein|nr:DUF4209 domain-containing protein [Candidatus Cloacimonadota bacterium]
MDILNSFLKEIESELMDGLDIYEKLLMMDCDRNLMEYQSELAAFSIPFSYLIEDSDFSISEYEYNRISEMKMFPDFILYWDNRRKHTTNPVFRFTYSRLLWEFRKEPHVSISVEDVMDDIVSSAVKISDVGSSVMNLHQVMTYLSNALYIALCTKKDKLIRDVVDQVMVYCGRTDLINHNCVWFPVFFRLLKNRRKLSLSDLEINQIVEFLESVMSVLFYPQDIIRIAEVLAAYYEQNKDRETVCNILDLAYDCTGKTITSGIGMAGIYTHLHDLAQKYAYKDLVTRIIKKMDHIGQMIKGEMRLHKIKYPKNVQDAMKSWQNTIRASIPELIKNHGFIQVLVDLSFMKIPDIRDLYTNQRRPLSILESIGISECYVDDDGIPITTNMIQLDETAKMIKWFIHEYFHFEISSFTFIMHELFSHYAGSKQDILELVQNSTNLTKKTIEIVSNGISEFFEGNYSAAVHLLVPQFEDILRSFISSLGGIIRKKNHFTGGYDRINLDEALNSEEIKRVLNDSTILYMKSILSHRQGLNLRNNLCHGLIKTCNYSTALIVIQLAVILTVLDINVKTNGDSACDNKPSKRESNDD